VTLRSSCGKEGAEKARWKSRHTEQKKDVNGGISHGDELTRGQKAQNAIKRRRGHRWTREDQKVVREPARFSVKGSTHRYAAASERRKLKKIGNEKVKVVFDMVFVRAEDAPSTLWGCH